MKKNSFRVKYPILFYITLIYLSIGIIISIVSTSLTATTYPNKNVLDLYIETWWLQLIIIIAWPIFLGGLGIY